MGPLEENGYRFGVVLLVFGISRQLLDMGGYDGRNIAYLGALFALFVVVLSTLRTLGLSADGLLNVD